MTSPHERATPLKLVDRFTYLGSKVSSTEKYINTQLAKAWTTNDSQSVRLKSDLTDKIKHFFVQATVVSILFYEFTTFMLTKRMEKKSLTAITQDFCEQSWTSFFSSKMFSKFLWFSKHFSSWLYSITSSKVGNAKVPFSITSTPRCRGGRYCFPWIAQLYPWSVPYNAEG